MSQAKVDRYKEEKKHRKEEVAKAKRKKALARVIGVIVAVAIVCWIGYSGYNLYQRNRPVKQTEVDLSAIQEYYTSLSGIEQQ